MDNSIGAPPQVLSQHQVNILYEILRRFDNIAHRSGLNYSIACGTALGAVLRGGLIPWDEDADLLARSDEFSEKLPTIVRNSTGQLIIKRYTHWSDGRGWYKIYMPTIDFPNVDMYLFEYKPLENVWRPSDNEIVGRKKMYLDPDQIISRERVNFGPLRLPIFQHPERFFDRYYGPQWCSISSKTPKKEVIKDFRPCLPILM
jgi:hypothetical protein